MNRLPVFWVQAPDQEDADDRDHYIAFSLRDRWVATDDQQLILPITLLERDGEEIDPTPGLLKQYGGESLLNDLLLADVSLEEGQTFILGHEEGTGRYLNPVERDD